MFGIFARKYPGLPELCTNLRQCQATHRTVEKYPEHRGWAQSSPFLVRVIATHKQTHTQDLVHLSSPVCGLKPRKRGIISHYWVVT